MKFDDILSRVKNPEIKSAMEKMDAEERRTFENDFVLQVDAAAAAEELRKGKEDLARLQAAERQWDNFYNYSGAETVEQRRALEKQYHDRYAGYPELERQLREQEAKVRDLEAKSRDARAAAGNEPGEEEVPERKETPAVDLSKYLTVEALAGHLKTFGDDVVMRVLNTVHTASIPAAIQVTDLQRKAKEELGIDLDIDRLGTEAKRFNNIISGYDYMTRDLYIKKQHDLDVKAAEEKAKSEYQRGLTEGRTRSFNPEDATGGDFQGNLASMMRGEKGDTKVPEIPADYAFDGSILAKAAAKEFRELEAQGKVM